MTKDEKRIIIDFLHRYKLCGMNYIEPIMLNRKKVDQDDLPNKIDELENYVKHCSLCELSKIKNNTFFSLGDIYSDIMIIGTNCHFLDDNINKILKNIIEKVLLIDFNKVYITNILKCNVDMKVDTVDKSILLCKDYVIKQIELIKPKLIITIGTAFHYLLDSNENLFNISGNLYNYNGIKLIPLLDLEFIYKNPSYKQDMLNDLKKIKMIMG